MKYKIGDSLIVWLKNGRSYEGDVMYVGKNSIEIYTEITGGHMEIDICDIKKIEEL
jgi:hypothetical protein